MLLERGSLMLPPSIRHLTVCGQLPPLAPGSARPSSLSVGYDGHSRPDDQPIGAVNDYRPALVSLAVPVRNMTATLAGTPSPALSTLFVHLGDYRDIDRLTDELEQLAPSLTKLTLRRRYVKYEEHEGIRLGWAGDAVAMVAPSVAHLALIFDCAAAVEDVYAIGEAVLRYMAGVVRKRASRHLRHLSLAIHGNAEDGPIDEAADGTADAYDDLISVAQEHGLSISVGFAFRRPGNRNHVELPVRGALIPRP